MTHGSSFICRASSSRLEKEPLVVLLIHRQSARRMAGPVIFIIRDGWGINPGGRDQRKENGDATLLASTPFHESVGDGGARRDGA